MAKQKLSEKDITSIKTGGYLHIILPAITPGTYNSYRIPVNALLAGIGNTPVELAGETGNVTYSIPANTFVEKIMVFQSGGTPTVRIGTTPNGQEIMMDTEVTDFAQVKPELYTVAGQDIYFTITAGYIDIRMDTYSNYHGGI